MAMRRRPDAIRKNNTGDKPASKRISRDGDKPSGSFKPERKFGTGKPASPKSRFREDSDTRRPSSDERSPRRTSAGKFGQDRPVRKSYGGKAEAGPRKTGRFSTDDKPERKKYNTSSDRPDRRTSNTGKFGQDRPARKAYGDRDSEAPRKTGRFSSAEKPERKSFRRDEGDKPVRRTSSGNKFESERPTGRNYRKPEGGAEERSFRPRTSTDRTEGKPPFRSSRNNDGKPERRPSSGYRKTEDKPRFSKDENRSDSNFRAKSPRKSASTYTHKTDRKVARRTREQSREEDVSPLNIRLNRYISNAGISSRREADKLIGAGLVSVNGVVITEMGHQVKPGDEVRYNNTRLNADKKVYIIINKPKDTITTLDDPDKRRIITDLVKEDGLPRLYPVGRLDRNTTGVLLLTNDGELTQRLMHPKYEVKKIYLATLVKNMRGEDLWTLQNGVELEDGFIKPDSVGMPDPTAKNEIGVEIHSGRNRIVHRMFEHLGYPLEKLDRVWYAGLTRKGLKRGAWRHLEDRELKALKKLVKLA